MADLIVTAALCGFLVLLVWWSYPFLLIGWAFRAVALELESRRRENRKRRLRRLIGKRS